MPLRHRFNQYLVRVAAVAALAAGSVAVIPTQSVSAADPSTAVVQRAVSFTVQNVNRSKIACHADGDKYQVRGHITGTPQALSDPQGVTLILHGLSYGEFFSDYTAQAGYNFADKQAASGHVTVTVDRLGYGASDKPDGQNICFGSRADVAHQMVQQLKSGGYSTAGAASVAFPKVVLAGHSVGSIIAASEAYSFGGIDGLLLLSYSDTDVSPAAMLALQTASIACRAGGGPQNGKSGVGGYVYFGADTPAQFIAAHFYTPGADSTVVNTTAVLRSRDPCGDILSYKAAVAANLANIGSITVPTLVMTGANDAIYPVPASKQAGLLTGSSDVTPITIADTGHALTLHSSRDEFSTDVASWLTGHGFGGWAMPVGSADTGGGGAARSDGSGWAAWGAVLLCLAAGVGLFGLRARRRRPFPG